MWARFASKLMLLVLVATACLGSYVSCDGGGMYNRFGGVYDTFGGYYDTVGGYVWGDDYYYEEPFWGGYTYEPYLGEYYDGGYGEAVVWY